MARRIVPAPTVTSITPVLVTSETPPPDPSRTSRHVLRTVLQVCIAVAVAIPASAAAFGLSAATTSKIAGALGLIVIVITAIQNAGEDAGVVPTLLGNPTSQWLGDAIQAGQQAVASAPDPEATEAMKEPAPPRKTANSRRTRT